MSFLDRFRRQKTKHEPFTYRYGTRPSSDGMRSYERSKLAEAEKTQQWRAKEKITWQCWLCRRELPPEDFHEDIAGRGRVQHPCCTTCYHTDNTFSDRPRTAKPPPPKPPPPPQAAQPSPSDRSQRLAEEQIREALAARGRSSAEIERLVKLALGKR